MRDLLAPLREKEMKFIRPPFFITLDLFANNFNDVIYCLVCFLGAVSTRMVALKTNIWPVWSPIQGKSSKKRIPNWRNLNVLQLWCPLSLRLPSCHTKKSKKKEKNKDNEQNMPEEPLENRHELQSGVENEKEISKKKRSKESRIQNQTISTRTKISPKNCQELQKRSVERLSYQILRRMFSWKILKTRPGVNCAGVCSPQAKTV